MPASRAASAWNVRTFHPLQLLVLSCRTLKTLGRHERMLIRLYLLLPGIKYLLAEVKRQLNEGELLKQPFGSLTNFVNHFCDLTNVRLSVSIQRRSAPFVVMLHSQEQHGRYQCFL